MLYPWEALAPGNLFSGGHMVKKKRKHFPRHPPASPKLLMLPLHIHIQVAECWPHFLSRYTAKQMCTKHSYLSGSTNPCPNLVHMETFPTSVFSALKWLIATTTKICSKSCFTQALAKSFKTNYHTPLLPVAKYAQRLGISHPLERHPFSGLVHSAGELLHIP